MEGKLLEEKGKNQSNNANKEGWDKGQSEKREEEHRVRRKWREMKKHR